MDSGARAGLDQRGADGKRDDVTSLLRSLRARLSTNRATSREGHVRSVAGAYERLLSHRDSIEDVDLHLHQELARIRQMVAGASDVFHVVESMDLLVERCSNMLDTERRLPQAQATNATMSSALRLLVALAGGDDGRSFILEDPTRVPLEERVVLGQKRIGDDIRMSNAGLVDHYAALFERQCIPLDQDRVLPTSVVSSFGAGIPEQRKELWNVVEREPGDEYSSAGPEHLFVGHSKQLRQQYASTSRFLTLRVRITQGNQFMMMSVGSCSLAVPTLLHDFERKLTERQESDQLSSVYDTDAHADVTKLETSPKPSDVFFWDGTQKIISEHWKKHLDRDDDATSLTENSSTDNSDIFGDSSDLWSLPRSSGWESIGDRHALPYVHLPRECGSHRPLSNLTIPIGVSCQKARGRPIVQVHADDIIEDALHALCGVDSVLFRRDGHSAAFVLPHRHQILLHDATLSSTGDLLQTFREAGTHFIRLEFLATFYAQDPRRGGKSLQAFGNAILAYLSAHQARVMKLSQGENRIHCVTSLVAKTRRMRRVLETVASAIGCDCQHFWPLIVNREFPSGISLLNFLYDRLVSMETWDTNRDAVILMQWLLEKSSAPFLEVLSDIVIEGVVAETTDSHGEFELTQWTRELVTSAEFAGGDKLLAREFSSTDGSNSPLKRLERMFPSFLQMIVTPITHLGRLQRVRCDVASGEKSMTRTRISLGFHCDRDQVGTDESEEESPVTKSIAPTRVETVTPDSNEVDGSQHHSLLDAIESNVHVRDQSDEVENKRQESEESSTRRDAEPDDDSSEDIVMDAEVGDIGGEQLPAASTTPEVDQREVVVNEDAVFPDIHRVSSAFGKESQGKNCDGTSGVGAASSQVPGDPRRENLSGASEWRFSVRVNTAAGRRSADIFSPDAGTDAAKKTRLQSEKGSVRVLREPGGGGAAAYECLYANPSDGGAYQTEAGKLNGEVAASGENPAARVLEDHKLTGVGEDESSDESETVPVQYSWAQSKRVELPIPHPFFADDSCQPIDTAILTRVVGGPPDPSCEIFTPFTLLVDAGVVRPIQQAVTNLNEVVLRSFLASTELMVHLDWLRRLMLMSEGLCMDTLARDVLSGLHSPTTRAHWGTADHLLSALTLAMVETREEPPAVVQRFQYRTAPQLQEMLGSAMSISMVIPQFVRNIEFIYDVEWPLGVILTSQALRQYAAIHSWLMHARLTAIEMKDAWMLLRDTSRHDEQVTSSKTYRALAEVFHKTQYVIGAFNEVFCTMVLMSSWAELVSDIKSSSSLMDVRVYHECYVNAASECCFLDDAGREVREPFEMILETAWKASELLRAFNRQSAGFTRGQERASALREAHVAARRELMKALRAVGHDRPRSVRVFAEYLLVRIDFNSYYCA